MPNSPFIVLLSCILLLSSCLDQAKKKEDTAQWWTTADKTDLLHELDRSTQEIREAIQVLNDAQWHFREDSNGWSISEIIEHLELQNQLHYREIYAVSNAPQLLEFRKVTAGQDEYFIAYADNPTPGISQWFLKPLGRFCTKEAGQAAFFRARQGIRDFVAETSVDLRKQFTFRSAPADGDFSALKIGQVRDLHQLVLTGIAHTDRHLQQIHSIKAHPNFPD